MRHATIWINKKTVYSMIRDAVIEQTSKKITTEAGLEPTRDKPNRFLVDRLNHSATRSYWLRTVATISQILRRASVSAYVMHFERSNFSTDNCTKSFHCWLKVEGGRRKEVEGWGRGRHNNSWSKNGRESWATTTKQTNTTPTRPTTSCKLESPHN